MEVQHPYTRTHLGIVWLEASLLSTSPLVILSLLQLLAVLLRPALIGSEAAGGVGLEVCLKLQDSSEGAAQEAERYELCDSGLSPRNAKVCLLKKSVKSHVKVSDVCIQSIITTSAGKTCW